MSCSCTRTGLLGAFEVVERGGMGSGVVFSSTLTVDLSFKAWDICAEERVDDRVEGCHGTVSERLLYGYD